MEGPILILGGLGQDGQLLADHMLNSGKTVISIIRPRNKQGNILVESNPERERHKFIEIDLTYTREIQDVVKQIKPESVFHLATVHATRAKMESDAWSEKKKETEILHVDLLNALASTIKKFSSHTKLIFAGSSRMFSNSDYTDLQVNEKSKMRATDFYGETKIAGHEILMNNRERNGLDFKTAILFNHESELRKSGFLFRDLAFQIAKSLVNGTSLEIWNANSRGDWHSARDTVKGMTLLSNASDVASMILCSGEVRSVASLISEYYNTYHPETVPRIISAKAEDNPVILGSNSVAKSEGWTIEDSIVSTLNRIVIQEMNLAL